MAVLIQRVTELVLDLMVENPMRILGSADYQLTVKIFLVQGQKKMDMKLILLILIMN